MEEETERISINLSKDVNQDEAIMAQEREIEREIAETNPLIGPKCDLALLQKEYAKDDLIYQQKVNVRNLSLCLYCYTVYSRLSGLITVRDCTDNRKARII
ncbi:hypothetical protein AVEN_133579-1 [Araneus ventricosus]|uniref:Uncharacterized protein n=1 Tax=Araneus ventricosus TaxID=182803 RepID=A0A4Y2PE23_ARAVE|nr:hypothetical protein AVEN_133579-1 [Araneus ventricosus]